MPYDIIIIGGGCAGISAAIYAGSRGKQVLLLEREPQLGGTICNVSTITHFPGVAGSESGISLAKRMGGLLTYESVTILQDTVIKADLDQDTKIVETTCGRYEAGKIIIAAGTAQKELALTESAPHLKAFVSHNASGDREGILGKTVFVIGGSDGAAKEALYLSAFAARVCMIVMEERLGTIKEFAEKIKAARNIDVFAGSVVTGINGKTQLESVEIIDSAAKQKTVIEAPGGCLFVYTGSTPNTGWCQGLSMKDGYLLTDEFMQTSAPGVYAAGDIRDKAFRQISTAVSDGTIAAIHASTQ